MKLIRSYDKLKVGDTLLIINKSNLHKYVIILQKKLMDKFTTLERQPQANIYSLHPPDKFYSCSLEPDYFSYYKDCIYKLTKRDIDNLDGLLLIIDL